MFLPYDSYDVPIGPLKRTYGHLHFKQTWRASGLVLRSLARLHEEAQLSKKARQGGRDFSPYDSCDGPIGP